MEKIWGEMMCYTCDGCGTWDDGQTCTLCSGDGYVYLLGTGKTNPIPPRKNDNDDDFVPETCII